MKGKKKVRMELEGSSRKTERNNEADRQTDRNNEKRVIKKKTKTEINLYYCSDSCYLSPGSDI